MKWRTSLLLAAGVLVVAAVAIGSVVTLGLGGGAARPKGEETILSIEPAELKVSCGPEPVTIQIFLADLAARPSPRTPDASYGVVGFQFLLRYDPEIVRIARPVDVQINPGLNLEDADGDGLARSFLLASDIDDFAGEALLGGASFVPGGAGPADNFEEGPDPVAKGAPLLLMTVRFQTVGHGTTVLTLRDPAGAGPPEKEEPQVLDPSAKPYEPVVVRDASLTVEGGDCPAPPPATPRPTPKPTSTPVLPPTMEPRPTPAPLTPTPAAEAGRGDCPQDWAVYHDQDGYFSLCYPADWSAIVAEPQAYFGHTFSLRSPEVPGADRLGDIALTLYWEESSPFDLGVLSERCDLPPHWRELKEVTLALAGRSVPACVGDVVDFENPEAGSALDRGTFAEIPLGPGEGYVVLFLFERKDTSVTLGQTGASILDSLRVGE